MRMQRLARYSWVIAGCISMGTVLPAQGRPELLDSVHVALVASPCNHRICLERELALTRATAAYQVDSVARRAAALRFSSFPSDIRADGALCATRKPAIGLVLVTLFWSGGVNAVTDANECVASTPEASMRLAELRSFHQEIWSWLLYPQRAPHR